MHAKWKRRGGNRGRQEVMNNECIRKRIVTGNGVAKDVENLVHKEVILSGTVWLKKTWCLRKWFCAECIEDVMPGCRRNRKRGDERGGETATNM